MRQLNQIFLYLLISILGMQLSSCTKPSQDIQFVNLKVQDLDSPVGVVGSKLKFSWQLESTGTVTVDSIDIRIGDVPNEEYTLQEYQVRANGQSYTYLPFAEIGSNMQYWWKIRVKLSNGKYSDWSETKSFVTGIQNEKEWKAKLVGGTSVQMIRKTFTVNKEVKSAYANATSSGLYELHLNGKKVGDRVLDPVQTNTHKRLVYATYDVTKQIKQGKNGVGFFIGGGAYGHLYKSNDRYVLLQLNINYTDGTKEVIYTDTTWKGSEKGPITYTGMYEGEKYDARNEVAGWDTGDFDDSAWINCTEKEHAYLYPQLQPIREIEVINPISTTKLKGGKAYIFDLGKNITGYPRIKVNVPAGTKITIRTSEILNNDGTINYWTSGREWKLEYIAKGGGVETWQPRFSYTGFRYIEVAGLSQESAVDDVQGVMTHSDVPQTGTFSCSNELINRIQSAYVLSQVGNLVGFPTDCPHRERLGWLGDALQIGFSANYNLDMQYFWKKWFRDMDDDLQADGSVHQLIPFPNFGDEQDPVWQSASIIMPWEMYWYYGDQGFLQSNYARMERMMDFYASLSKDFIIEKNRWGDWVRPYREENTNGSYLTTTYYFKCATIMAKAAKVLGDFQKYEKYNQLAANIKGAINKKWYHNGAYAENTQTANAIALDFGIVESDNVQAVLNNLIKDIEEHKGHLTTGVVGQMPLVCALQKFNRDDVIFEMVTKTDYPSLGFMLEKGATTFWEKYHYGTGSYDSHNHVFLGGPWAKWFYDGLAGIKPLEPGFKTIEFAPQILTDQLSASVNTNFGLAACRWQRGEDHLQLNVKVPQGATAVLNVPLMDELGKTTVSVNDEKVWTGSQFKKLNGIKLIKSEGGSFKLKLKSGLYQFVIK
ncbi:hypothetical protein EMN47_02190 [Prolixibacteraceae bacterium JC049]|nr:hypothetical protein [Prolixibacteraceae bacterium JC049]